MEIYIIIINSIVVGLVVATQVKIHRVKKLVEAEQKARQREINWAPKDDTEREFFEQFSKNYPGWSRSHVVRLFFLRYPMFDTKNN